MNWKKYLPVTTLLLTACMTTPEPRTDGSDVALSQEAYVDGPIVKPVAVLEDSRCPADAQCVWAGRVRLKMLWMHPRRNREFELSTDQSASIADGAITLLSVRPEKRTDRPTKPEDYRFSLRFDGGY